MYTCIAKQGKRQEQSLFGQKKGLNDSVHYFVVNREQHKNKASGTARM